MNSHLRIAIIGQSNFAAEVLELLLEKQYNVVGVFTIPDKASREDVLASTAKQNGIPVFKISAWRRKGVPITEVLEQYVSVRANLNVLPYCSQFIPMNVIDGAAMGSICYHPSILPKHRGASAISWTFIEGDEIAGFSIFWADDGLDTGPILLQKQITLEPTDTLDTIYKRFLYPEGIKSMGIAVDMVAQGIANKIPQSEIGASYDPPMFKLENQVLDLNQPAWNIFNFIRGLDSTPGAIVYAYNTETKDYEQIRLYAAHLYSVAPLENAQVLTLKNYKYSAYIHDDGLLLQGTDGNAVNVRRLKRGTKVINASDWFKPDKTKHIINFNEDELIKREILTEIWRSILKCAIESDTDFFAYGGNSMDVVRLIEECRDAFDVALNNESIFMAPVFEDFFCEIVQNLRQVNQNCEAQLQYEYFLLKANKREIKIPTQLFINGQFLDAEQQRTLAIINPSNEQVLCQVACASVADVDQAVKAAHNAFYGAWRRVSARERGQLMLKLAQLMEEHKEELATIEAIDSGAVYTLALKTHVGMSIDAWRYFAGWCDKIHGHTIPVSAAKPNNVLTFTKKEPIGVVGLITPWNYPLMMLSWKMAACIAAGNTCLIKPAQTCPLTALKFAELTVKAGFPPGVINIVPGKGSEAGQAIADHRLVRKLGFTGSTPVGQHIMQACAASNMKKCSMELGGKSPLIIFADCDLDKAVKHGMSAVFFNKGENCIAAGRLFVEDRIHDEFVRRVLKDVRSITIGDPLNRATAHGPQNHRAHFEKLIEFCQRGVEQGAKLIYGGRPVPNTKGLYFEPTIFTNVEDYMFIAQEESFGPIMIISKFNASDIESVMKRANRSEYGLASGVFTKDLNKALKFADNIEAGTVFVNVYNKTDVAAPFGGFKQSGFGKDLGEEALNEYLKTKCVTIEY